MKPDIKCSFYFTDKGEKRVEIEQIFPNEFELIIKDDMFEYESILMTKREMIRLASELLALATKEEEE